MNYRDNLYKHLEDLQAQTAALMEVISITADDPLDSDQVRDFNSRVTEIANTTVEIEDAMYTLRSNA